MQALKYQASVGQDHRVMLDMPQLPCGTELEIIALVKHRPVQEKTDWSSKIGAFAHFKSLDEVAAYVETLREDRDVAY